MFDIGFTELLLVAIVALLVLGPERLPQALRTLGLWIGRMRRSFNTVRDEIEREIGMDDIRRQLHNEAVMEELRRIEQNVKATGTAAAVRSSGTDSAPDARSGAVAELSAGTAPVTTEPNPTAATGAAVSAAAQDSARTQPDSAPGDTAPRAGH